MLPSPAPDALAHSQRVTAHLQALIREAGGWIPFARFMEAALYAPGLGYYAAGAMKFGAAGDFVTAPELTPLFGRTLAHAIAPVLADSPEGDKTRGDILELGAGSGKLALDVLGELERLDALPARYAILEVSADLRERQRALLRERLPHLAERVRWLDALPESFSGAVVANEVLDALPVHLVHWRDSALTERGVAAGNDDFGANGFIWQERPIGDPALLHAAEQISVPDDYVSEICLAARGLVNSLAGCLQRGALLFIDYGFGAREFYHPQRSSGTLMCHYRHHAHGDPFFLPGLQDITAHVNFTDIAECGIDAGLELLGYTSQAFFLLNCGIADLLKDIPPENLRDYLPLSAQLQKLTSPAEMGELFKVMALGRGMAEPLCGFEHGDLTRTL